MPSAYNYILIADGSAGMPEVQRRIRREVIIDLQGTPTCTQKERVSAGPKLTNVILLKR